MDIQYIKIKEASEILGVSEATVRNYIASGKLKASRINARLIRINQNDLIELLNPNKKEK